jgi:hypothetical protein
VNPQRFNPDLDRGQRNHGLVHNAVGGRTLPCQTVQDEAQGDACEEVEKIGMVPVKDLAAAAVEQAQKVALVELHGGQPGC